MPYEYDSEERFQIRTKEDYLFIQNLLREGVRRGTIRYKYHLSRRMIAIIDQDLMSFDKYIVCPITGKEFKEISVQHVKKLKYKNIDEYCLDNDCKSMTFDTYLKRSAGGGNKMSEETRKKVSNSITGKKHSEETLKKLSALNSGENNPSKRLDVRKKLKENHVSKVDPARWEEIKGKIKDSKRVSKLSEEKENKNE